MISKGPFCAPILLAKQNAGHRVQFGNQVGVCKFGSGYVHADPVALYKPGPYRTGDECHGRHCALSGKVQGAVVTSIPSTLHFKDIKPSFFFLVNFLNKDILELWKAFLSQFKCRETFCKEKG